MNHLELLNKVAREARPAHNACVPIEDENTPFVETDLDSLDMLMTVMYFAIIYEISDDIAKDFHPETPKQLFDFVQQHKNRDPASIDEAIGMIK
jgi:hypothetical protein